MDELAALLRKRRRVFAHHQELHQHETAPRYSIHSHQYPRVPSSLLIVRQDAGTLTPLASSGSSPTNVQTGADATPTSSMPSSAASESSASFETSQQVISTSTTSSNLDTSGNDNTATDMGGATASVTVVPIALTDSPLVSLVVSAAQVQGTVQAPAPSNGTSASPSVYASPSSLLTALPVQGASSIRPSNSSSITSLSSTTDASSTLTSSTSGPSYTSGESLSSGSLTVSRPASSPIINGGIQSLSTPSPTATLSPASSRPQSSLLAPSTSDSIPSQMTSDSMVSGVFTGGGTFPSSSSSSSSSISNTRTAGIDGLTAASSDSASTSMATKTIVGGVVGGVAGLTVFLLLVVILLRWYRRRSDYNHRALAEGDAPGRPETAAAYSGTNSTLVPATATSLIGRLSRSRAGPPPTEQAPTLPSPVAAAGGFQRISGRKLPSRFSPGMEGPGPAYPSGSSHYPSGGTLASSAFTAEDPFADPSNASPTEPTSFPGAGAIGVATSTGGNEAVRQGPARTPTIHHPGRAEMLLRSSHPPPVVGRIPSPAIRVNSRSRFIEEEI